MIESLIKAQPDPMRLEVVGQFIERTMSDATRETYTVALRQFFQFLAVDDPRNVTPSDVRRYRDYLKTELNRSDGTIRLKIAAVRAFYSMMVAMQLMDANPSNSLLVATPPPSNKIRTDALTPEEVRQLLSAPDCRKPTGARDHALLLLMLRTSLRVSEACQMKLSDIERVTVSNKSLWVYSVKVKGGKTRQIPIPDDVMAAIHRYLDLDAQRRAVLHTDGPGCFVFQPDVNYRTLRFNKAIGRDTAWHILQHWCDVAGLTRRGPHALRATAITRAFDLKQDLRSIQAMSGHADVNALIAYDQKRRALTYNSINELNYDDE